MMHFLSTFHSHNRWLIALFGIVSLVLLANALLRKAHFGKATSISVRLYIMILSIQFVIGIVLLIDRIILADGEWASLTQQFEHAITMLLAVGAAHATAKWKKAENDIRINKTLLFLGISLVLIIVGVIRLRGKQFWIGM